MKLGKTHLLSFIGVNVTFFRSISLALPACHVATQTALQFADWNMVSSVGAYIFGFSQLLFLFIVIKTIRGGKKASDEVWMVQKVLRTIPLPAPYHTFSTPPALPARAHRGKAGMR